MYRMRIVHDPSNVAQPREKETKVGPGGEADEARTPNLDDMKRSDELKYKEIKQKEEQEKAKELKRVEKEQQEKAGVNYNSRARKKVTPVPTDDDAPDTGRRRGLTRKVNVQFKGRYKV